MFNSLLESIVLFAVISVIPNISFADEVDTTGILNPDMRAHLETEFMEKKLALNSSTASLVYDINLKYAKINQEIMSSKKRNAEKYREVKKNLSEKDDDLKKVLTGDQYKKYTETKKEMMETIKEKVKEQK